MMSGLEGTLFLREWETAGKMAAQQTLGMVAVARLQLAAESAASNNGSIEVCQPTAVRADYIPPLLHPVEGPNGLRSAFPGRSAI